MNVQDRLNTLEEQMSGLGVQIEDEKRFNHEKNKVIDQLCVNLDSII